VGKIVVAGGTLLVIVEAFVGGDMCSVGETVVVTLVVAIVDFIGVGELGGAGVLGDDVASGEGVC
jgi:hypothetical protein